MSENKLRLTTQESAALPHSPNSLKTTRTELLAKMERLWLTDPEQFNPMRNSIERERIRKFAAILSSLSCPKGSAVDLGCGYGYLSRQMRDCGFTVEAVDIASNALKAFRKIDDAEIKLTQDTIPSTRLEDDAYDLVICTEVIGFLSPRDYRLLMAELSRLIKRNGHVICSTAIDVDSEDSLERFSNLAETEFEIIKWFFSYHLLQIKLKRFFKTPEQYIKASKTPDIRYKELNLRSGISHLWYKVNTSKWGCYLWYPFKELARPFVYLLQESRGTLLFLESVCRFFWSDAGISHATFVAKRRPLIMPTKDDLESVEPKGKRQVWE